MRQNMKRGMAFLLALCLMLSLAACGGGGGRQTLDPADGIGGASLSSLRDEGYVFVREFIDLSIPGRWPRLLGISGETLFINYSTETAQGGMAPTVATVQTDGSGFTRFWIGRGEANEEDGRFEQISQGITAAAVRPDGGLLAIIEETSHISEGDDWEFEQKFDLIAFGSDGIIEREEDLSQILPIVEGMGLGVNRIQALADGRVLLSTWETLYVLSSNWTLEAEFTEGWQDVQSMLALPDGSVLVSTWDVEEEQKSAWYFDLSTGELQDGGEPVLAADFQTAVTGTEYELYVGNNTGLFGFDLSTRHATRLLEWADLDLQIPPVFAVSDAGDIFYFEENFGDESAQQQTTLVRLVKQDASNIVERIELIYGGIFIDWDIRQEIAEFNRRSATHRIRVVEYGDWMAMDQTEAIRRLNTDIITGNAPDILDFGRDLPFEQYARRGFLADIGALIDADSELNRSDFLDPVKDLLAVDGTLYTVMAQFNVQTLVGRADQVGPNMGWTMQEFLAAVDALPADSTVFDRFVTRQGFLNSVLGVNLGLFVDRETGLANFDSPLFTEYLAFAQTLPTDADVWGGEGSSPGDWTRPVPMPMIEPAFIDIAPPIGELPGGWDDPFAAVMLSEQVLWGFNIGFIEEQFGGPITFKGYPSEYGIGSAVVPQSMMGISANSRHQEAAWSFVRTMLTEGWQRDNVLGFATNRTILEEQMQAAMVDQRETIEDEEMGSWMAGEAPATQAQVDQVMALLNQADLLAMRDSTVLVLINEELLPFFAGDRSIQETVRIIQSRVQTYLSERG
ncbi:MAG: extracellular solute-binding protein [Oscillospiraceae bacterium]|nr:extracellular solute-binding protein [Oscillospiraceae bacterium]